jgi:DNA replication protein DnaC
VPTPTQSTYLTAADLRRLGRVAGSALVQVIAQRHSKTSTIVTTNRPITSRGEIIGDTTVVAALLDRLLHRSVVLHVGDSYRLRDHHARTHTLRAAASYA